MIQIKYEGKEYELIVNEISIIKTKNFNRVLRETKKIHNKFVITNKWV